MSVVAQTSEGRIEDRCWPVVAALSCGHFRLFPADDSVALNTMVLCFDCERGKRTVTVAAALSVQELVAVCDRCIEAQRIAFDQISPTSETSVDFEAETAPEALLRTEIRRLHAALGVQWRRTS